MADPNEVDFSGYERFIDNTSKSSRNEPTDPIEKQIQAWEETNTCQDLKGRREARSDLRVPSLTQEELTEGGHKAVEARFQKIGIDPDTGGLVGINSEGQFTTFVCSPELTSGVRCNWVKSEDPNDLASKIIALGDPTELVVNFGIRFFASMSLSQVPWLAPLTRQLIGTTVGMEVSGPFATWFNERIKEQVPRPYSKDNRINYPDNKPSYVRPKPNRFK
jgi:hypothetical protein